MEEQEEAETTAKPLFVISWTLTAQCPQWPGYLPAYKGEKLSLISNLFIYLFFFFFKFILFYGYEWFCLDVCLCTS